jgi:hypothetical protein
MSEANKDWKSVLELYAGHPHDALILAQLLAQLKEHIESRPKGRREALAQLEFAIKTLYPHSGFNKVSEKLRVAVAGKLSVKQYRKLRELA